MSWENEVETYSTYRVQYFQDERWHWYRGIKHDSADGVAAMQVYESAVERLPNATFRVLKQTTTSQIVLDNAPGGVGQ